MCLARARLPVREARGVLAGQDDVDERRADGRVDLGVGRLAAEDVVEEVRPLPAVVLLEVVVPGRGLGRGARRLAGEDVPAVLLPKLRPQVLRVERHHVVLGLVRLDRGALVAVVREQRPDAHGDGDGTGHGVSRMCVGCGG